METLTINHRNIYIVQSHNQVLEAWEKDKGLNVFTLDYHTDTREAFHSYSYWRADSEIKSGKKYDHELRKEELTDQKINQYLENRITIDQINDNLKHDEHLDFAVRTDMIDRAFILAKNSNSTSSNPNVHIAEGNEIYRDQRLIEYSPPCIPGCSETVHDEECRTLRADSSLENIFLDEALRKAEIYYPSFFDNYILDLDCDYFNTEKSLYPEEIGTFHKLVRESDFITIALEPECVKICRHDGCNMDSEMILARLIEIIKAA